jgi:hypothetical protein
MAGVERRQARCVGFPADKQGIDLGATGTQVHTGHQGIRPVLARSDQQRDAATVDAAAPLPQHVRAHDREPRRRFADQRVIRTST